MKIVSLVSFLAALAAGILIGLPLEVVGYFLLTAAIGCIWAQDYSPRRTLRFDRMRSGLRARDVFRPRPTTGRVLFRAPALASEPHRLAA